MTLQGNLNMTKPIKATRATIRLGDIELDVFQMPDGEYRMSQSQVLRSIEIEAKRYTQIRDSKEAQTLALKEIEHYPIVLENGSRANTLSIFDVPKVWRVCSKLNRGNQKILDCLLDACLLEALERRADTAFNVIRTEQERNDRLAARMKGKLTRRTLTDAIKDYIDRNNQLSANYKKWIYANCSDQINTFVLGRKANQLKSQFSIKQIREACNTKQLKELDLVEELICREIEEGGLEPLEATQFVLATKRIRQLPIA